MKVLHVIPAVSPKYGGPSHALVPMCKALLARGVDVQIASTDAEPGGRLPLELETPTTYEGVPAIFFKTQGGRFTYSPRIARWLNQNVSAFDVVHIHGVFSHACLSAARACQRLDIPYIIRPLGNLEQWSLSQKPFRKNLFLKLCGTKMIQRAAAVHYVCESEKQLSERALGMNHGVVIPLGIQLNANASPAAERSAAARRPYVLVLSRLHPSKGIDVLLEAFLTVRNQEPLRDWQLMIAGEGSRQYQALLRRIIEDGNADDSVRLTGWLEGEAKARALAEASLLALPSHHEPFGLCLLEAMANGIPVLIGPHVGLMREIQEAGAGWISAVETSTLAETLKSALSDDDERRRRGAAGRELARKFDWNKLGEMLAQLYESIKRRATGNV
jgi:glycosyltransferase involved in cell wall biosynthesis